MLEIASQMILCLLLAALIGAIIGYLLGKSTCAKHDCNETNNIHTSGTSHTNTVGNTHNTSAQGIAAATTKANSTDSSSISKGKTPEVLSGPRNGKKDNLTRIKGIGVKIDETLNSIGIYHFDQIANWTAENMAWADSTLGFPGRAEREQWVAQAKALAAGEETEFSKRVDAGQVASSKKH